jgi:hypothetical protein
VFGIICNLVDARFRFIDAQRPKFFDELGQARIFTDPTRNDRSAH